MQDKIVVMSGATSGIGRVAAKGACRPRRPPCDHRARSHARRRSNRRIARDLARHRLD